MKMNKRWQIVIGMIIGLLFMAWTIVNVVYAYWLSHPEVRIAKENRQKFAHVVVLIDGTRSVSDVNFGAAKQIVSRGIISSCGIEDIAVGYDIRPTFTLANTIFGGTFAEQPPQTSAQRRSEILDILNRNRESSQKGIVDEDVYSLIRELNPYRQNVEKVRSDWSSRVDNLKRPEQLGSDICGALRAVQEEFRSRLDRQAEKWLFVLSDFTQDSRRAPRCLPISSDAFSDVNIALIYPYDSNSPDWEKIEAYWKGYFRDKKMERLPFSDAQRRRFVLMPNPTAGLEHHQIKTFWEYLWPLVRYEIVIALLMLAASGYMLLRSIVKKRLETSTVAKNL